MRSCFSLIFVFVCLFQNQSSVCADDWRQWMGNQRDGRWNEKGVVTEIPDNGLPVMWRTKIGGGYSGPAVANGKVYVTDFVANSGELANDPGKRNERVGVESIRCLDGKTGKELWKKSNSLTYKISYAVGPRATPTVAGDNVYMLGAEGDLICLKAATGEIVWQKNLAQEYKAETPIWGHSAHPLVHGDLLYCLAGGKDSVVVALNKKTGEQVWTALTASEIGYCPPSIAKIAGREDLVVWHADAVCGLDPASGKSLWTYPLAPQYKMSIAAPSVQGNRMFACGIGDTAAMFEFDEKGMPSKTVWQGKPKQSVFSGNATALWIDDVIYGSDCQSGQFVAVNAQDGKRLWETFDLTTGVAGRRASHGTAFAVQNGKHSYLFCETGELIIANLSASKFAIRGKMKVLEPTSECFGRSVVWSHPAFAEKCMFARNDKEIVCVDLSATSKPAAR
jgi:outer membrane protein assembly factor BamB